MLVNAASGVPWAIQMLADRLDGKPQQSVEVAHKTSIEELSLEELRSRVATLLAGTGSQDSGAGKPGKVH